MKREMSYRDKMILLIIAVVVIVVGGIFALIRPKYKAYVADKETYKTTKTEWDGIDAKLQQIDPLKDTITQTRNKAAETAELFVNDALASVNEKYDAKEAYYQVDQYLQGSVDDSKLRITEYKLSDVSSENLDYYYYTPDVVTYALLEAGDFNGNYAKDVTELMMENMVLSGVEPVEMLAQTVDITVEGKKEGLMAFLKAIKDNPETILVTAIQVDDYQFLGSEDEDNGQQPGAQTTVKEGEGISKMNLTVTLYNAKAIDEVKFD